MFRTTRSDCAASCCKSLRVAIWSVWPKSVFFTRSVLRAPLAGCPASRRGACARVCGSRFVGLSPGDPGVARSCRCGVFSALPVSSSSGCASLPPPRCLACGSRRLPRVLGALVVAAAFWSRHHRPAAVPRSRSRLCSSCFAFGVPEPRRLGRRSSVRYGPSCRCPLRALGSDRYRVGCVFRFLGSRPRLRRARPGSLRGPLLLSSVAGAGFLRSRDSPCSPSGCWFSVPSLRTPSSILDRPAARSRIPVLGLGAAVLDTSDDSSSASRVLVEPTSRPRGLSRRWTRRLRCTPPGFVLRLHSDFHCSTTARFATAARARPGVRTPLVVS